MLYHFPMNVYVRYVDLFHENGEVYVRRLPITSVLTGKGFVGILKTMGLLTDEERWCFCSFEDGNLQEFNGPLWGERELLWVSDSEGEFADYMVFPSDLSATDQLGDEPEEDLGPNVVRGNFQQTKRRA